MPEGSWHCAISRPDNASRAVRSVSCQRVLPLEPQAAIAENVRQASVKELSIPWLIVKHFQRF